MFSFSVEEKTESKNPSHYRNLKMDINLCGSLDAIIGKTELQSKVRTSINCVCVCVCV